MAFNQNADPHKPSGELEVEKYSDFPLVKINFILMIVSAVITVVGFLLMLGKGSGADEFNPDIFSTRRIVIGPTIAFIGFILMGVSIMWPSKHHRQEPENKKEDEI
ncbi:MAG: DUF3098 domain-containing protein [Paramuribaculum sp.]|nr:DUF3098 domain-containing protein [Paramuribaculum sp.]MDE7470170.1 DUF3098 domain-containing protein [Paramuribaculum sp.]